MFDNVDPLEKVLLGICFAVLAFAIVWGVAFPEWDPFADGGGSPGSASFEQPQQSTTTTPTMQPTSTPTPVATPTPAPTAAATGWRTVTSFSGSTDKTTSSFEIKGTEWRVKYSVQADDLTAALIYFYVHSTASTSFPETHWTCYQAECSDTEYVYSGPGTYYLKISAANIDKWTVEIEENL